MIFLIHLKINKFIPFFLVQVGLSFLNPGAHGSDDFPPKGKVGLLSGVRLIFIEKPKYNFLKVKLCNFSNSSIKVDPNLHPSGPFLKLHLYDEKGVEQIYKGPVTDPINQKPIKLKPGDCRKSEINIKKLYYLKSIDCLVITGEFSYKKSENNYKKIYSNELKLSCD